MTAAALPPGEEGTVDGDPVVAALVSARRATNTIIAAVLDLAAALDDAQHAADSAAQAAEFDRLRALALAMSPACPPLIGDHVPEQWLAEPRAETKEQDQ